MDSLFYPESAGTVFSDMAEFAMLKNLTTLEARAIINEEYITFALHSSLTGALPTCIFRRAVKLIDKQTFLTHLAEGTKKSSILLKTCS